MEKTSAESALITAATIQAAATLAAAVAGSRGQAVGEAYVLTAYRKILEALQAPG